MVVRVRFRRVLSGSSNAPSCRANSGLTSRSNSYAIRVRGAAGLRRGRRWNGWMGEFKMAWDVNRRTFVGGMGALAAAGLALPPYAKNGQKLNVLMIVTDQEQCVPSYPKGLLEKLPAHPELQELGMPVENSQHPTTPTTPPPPPH